MKWQGVFQFSAWVLHIVPIVILKAKQGVIMSFNKWIHSHKFRIKSLKIHKSGFAVCELRHVPPPYWNTVDTIGLSFD